MKRTYYNAKIILIRDDGTAVGINYERYKKIRYRINGKCLKVFLYSWGGGKTTEQFMNVDRIRITKFKM